MLLIPASRLALLFPWKTASQTLQARLGHLGRQPYPKLPAFNPRLRRVVHQHLTLADWEALPESREGYRVAVFVRNPYDRVVSGFRQLLRDVQVLPRLRHPSPMVRELIAEQVGRIYAGLSRAAFDVDRWFQQLPTHDLLEAGQNVALPLYPCTYWTHGEAGQKAEFIGRVETFEVDFQRMRERYALPPTSAENANRSDDLPARPDANGYLYAHRLRPRTIARINEVFAEDFEQLGYARLPAGPG